MFLSAFVLLVLQLDGPGAAAPAQEAQPSAEDVRATLTADPREVEVGEPVKLVLELEHPSDVTPQLSDDDVGLGRHWVVLESGPTVALPAPGDAAGTRRVTRKEWTVVVLAPCKVLPSLDVAFRAGSEEGASFSVLTPEGPLRVQSVLGAGAADHRPIKGFREELPERATSRVPWWAAVLGATGALWLAAWIWRVRARAVERTPPAASPLERLAELEGSVSDDLPALQALHYSLTALLREATDRRLGRGLSAATDAEWLATTVDEERLPADVRSRLADVLTRSEEVKYARHKPTRWAVDETLGAARTVLQGVGGVGGSAGNGARATARGLRGLGGGAS